MTLWLLAALLTKHFVADFPLQGPRHYLNKGHYGRWGGIEHALIHAVLTAFILLWFAPLWLTLVLALAEAVVHYHADWARMRLNAATGWTPDNGGKYWWLLGFDQWLHNATYVAIALAVRSVISSQ